MPFRSILQKLVEKVHGAQGAILLDWEGEAVDHYANISDYDIKFIGAHLGIILYNLRNRLQTELNEGDVKGFTINMDMKRFVVCPVDNDYFVVIVLSPESVPGLSRREVEAAVKSLRDVF